MDNTTHITIGMNQFPVHERTFRKNGKLYQSYRVRLVRDVDPTTGKRQGVDVTAPTMDKLTLKLKQHLTPFEYLLNPRYEVMKFSELAEQWYAAGCTTWEEPTKQDYRRCIDRYHLPLTRGLLMANVDPTFLQNLYKELLQVGVSPGVVRKIHALFRSIFAFAVSRRYAFSNPCDGLSVPKAITRMQDALSLDQQQRLQDACKAREDGPLYMTLLASGMRISEALGLTWDNVDFENGCLRIVATLVRTRSDDGTWAYRLRDYNKNRRHRTVYLSHGEMDRLREQRAWQKRLQELAGDNWQPVIHGLVFTTDCGMPLSYSAVEQRFKRLVTSLGNDMAHVHLHTLRHTAASNFYHATKDVLLTKEFLGHADVRNTVLYTHSREEDLIAIARARDAE